MSLLGYSARNLAPFYSNDLDESPQLERGADVFAESDLKRLFIPYRGLQKEPCRFIWETEKGDLLYLSEMATPHLFMTLRMLYNHIVPPAFRVGWCPKNRHSEIFEWDNDYKEQAVRKVYHELKYHRDDLDAQWLAELDDMERNARAIVDLGI
jgi:hypothetical protein